MNEWKRERRVNRVNDTKQWKKVENKKISTEGRFIYKIGIKRSFFFYKEMEKKGKIAYSIYNIRMNNNTNINMNK